MADQVLAEAKKAVQARLGGKSSSSGSGGSGSGSGKAGSDKDVVELTDANFEKVCVPQQNFEALESSGRFKNYNGKSLRVVDCCSRKF